MSDADRLYTPTFAWICGAHLLIAVPILSQFPVISAWVAQLGGDEVRIGEAMSAGILGGILGRPIVGPLLDRLGARAIFLVGGLLAAIGFPAYLVVEDANTPLLMVLRALHGAGMGALFPALYTIAADASPVARRTEGLAVFGAVGLFGLAVGPSYFGEALVAATSFDTWCWACAVTIGAGALMCAAAPQPPLAAPENRPSLLLGWAEAYRWRNLTGVWLATAAWGAAIACYMSFTEPLCRERGIPGVVWFFLPYGAVAIALRLGLGQLPDRIGPARMLVPSFLAQLPGLAILAFADAPWHLVVAGIFCGIGHGYAFPILTSLVVSRAPSDRVGVGINAFTIAIDVGQLVFNPVAGWLARELGFHALFGASALALLSSAIAFRGLDRPDAGNAT